ncbi:hypothetical protein SNOG_04745 [Parastagonospora nodorum SN15]|uniref:Peptidase A1 domain-containing protein n=1 Tax=Phaeosphaeria nodorum (strain SN15 / ATCC MYA-4574 / FGSC 10173) TaxID=321614 RepID=Q0UU19_PHANO|nr:hypothetical protein SNOG_04745 [Parastagonospora nodorum SN15]EAT88505.1 hypothetical protein SNOG_04745 [Parastagonospora nodorum SN15]
MSSIKPLAYPLVVESSGRWLGNDGDWSSFYVHVGTPPQVFQVLPSLSAQTLYLPLDKDCGRFNISDCGELRGVEVWASKLSDGFHPQNSTTWHELGVYGIGVGEVFRLNGNGIFGNDTAGLDTSGVIDPVNLENHPIMAYTTSDMWIGVLGLSPHTMNISDTVRPRSFLNQLKEKGHIPSLSFGYQAGAYHRFTHVPGSLVLGGYDRSRISGPTLRLSAESDIIVGLQGITSTLPNGTTNSLLATGIIATIDTAVSELWLPPSVCDAFALALGLTYFEAADRYVLTNAAHSALLAAPPSFNFTIGVSTSGGDIIIIEIPYAAFDLKAKAYFPLRRAANETQYALGRVFMQEIYLSVDSEREEFNISQAVFKSPMPESDLVTILPKIGTSDLKPPHPYTGEILPIGAIIGIVVGIVILALFLMSLGWWFWRRRSGAKGLVTSFSPETLDSEGKKDLELDSEVISEMHAPHGQSEMFLGGIVRQVNTELVEAGGGPLRFELSSVVEVQHSAGIGPGRMR